MPCQCGSTTAGASGVDSGSCECASGSPSEAGCGCGSTASATPSDRDESLARVVMELDRRVRSLEALRTSDQLT